MQLLHKWHLHFILFDSSLFTEFLFSFINDEIFSIFSKLKSSNLKFSKLIFPKSKPLLNFSKSKSLKIFLMSKLLFFNSSFSI